MAGDKSGNKDWRGGRRVAGGASPSYQEKAPDYMRRRDTTGQEIATAYRRKVALWGVLFLGLVGLLIYVLIPLPLRPPLLIATVTQYDYPLPPNAWTEEDQALLMQLDGQQKIVLCATEKDGKGQVADYNALWTGASQDAAFAMLEAKLRKAEANAGGPNNNVVMLYIGMHGAVRGDGEPCLIPPGPFAHDSSKWYSAKTLLDRLFGGKTKKRVKYLVFFDCSRVDTDWNLGWLYAGFPQRLGEAVKDLKIDNLYVITSSGPGQISWTAPELHGSVFGRFLYRGLQGWADKFAGNSDQVVTLGELFRYLCVNVSDWVKTHRDDEQTPLLFGKDGQIEGDHFPKKDDFALVAVPKHPVDESPATDKAEPAGHWGEIAEAWEKHWKLRERGARGRSPLKWQEYQHRLLYLEQLAMAGKVGEDKIGAQFAQVEQLADDLQKQDPEVNWPGYSLPQAKRLLEKLKQQASAVPKPQDSVPAGNAGGTKGKGNDVEKAPATSRPAPDYLVSAESVWQRLAGSDADPSLLEDLPPLPRERKADLVEIHFLHMLKAYLGRASNNDLRLAIKSRTLAEDAAWPRDLRAQYAIYGIMQQADRCRRLAEDRLFVGGSDQLSKARTHWEQADGGQGYDAAIQTAKEVAEAFDVRDRALAEVPFYSQWLLHRCQRDPKLDELAGKLPDLIEKTNTLSANLDRTLQDFGDPAAANYPWPKERVAAKVEIGQLLNALKAEFDAECNSQELNKNYDEGSPKDIFRRLGVVLSVPLVSGDVRNTLRHHYNDILENTRKRLARENPETNAVYGQDEKSSKPEQTAGAEFRARWPTHPALLILGQAWHAKPQSDPATDFADQGKQVRETLNTALDETSVGAWCKKSQDALMDPKAAPVAVRSGYADGDRQLRSVAALWVGREMPTVDISAELHSADRRNLLLWLAQRTVDDFWGPKPGQSKSYFQVVAEEYLRAAGALTPPCPLARKVKELAGEVTQRGVVRPTILQDIYLDADGSRNDPPQVQVKLDVAPGLMERGGEAAVFFQDQERHALAMKDHSDSRDSILRHPVPATESESSSNVVTLKTYLELGESAQDVKLAPFVRALYRGHVQSAPIQVVTLAGQETVVTRQERVPPAVLVKSTAVRKTSIIFIFDCSGSMNTPDVDVDVETIKKEMEEDSKKAKEKRQEGDVTQEGARSRIRWARKQLNRILEELAKQPNQYRVGLMTYGSRYAYDARVENDPDPNKNKKKYILHWPANGGPQTILTDPEELKDADPDTDFQVLLPLSDFNEEQRSIAESELKRLRPTGQTPLYYTVIKALEMLEKDKENRGHKRIVVITDGINDQSSLVDKMTLKYEAERALKDAGKSIDVRLEVIAFCIKPDPGQKKSVYDQALEDLESLVTGQNPPGQFIAPNDPSRLLDALEKLVETEKFMLSQGIQKVAELDAEKKQDLPLPAFGIYVPYSISVKEGGRAKVKADMEVGGGEFIKLLYVDERETGGSPNLLFLKPSLEHNASLRDNALVTSPDGQSQYDVKADLGKKSNGLATFHVTIQNHSDQEFSYRPKSVWAEIIPVLPSGEEKPGYTFYDLCFENGCEVPKLEFRAAGWPSEATKAKVLLWFKFLPTDADEELPFSDDRWQQAGDWKKFDLKGKADSPERTVVLQWKLEEKEGNPSCSVVVEQSVPSDMKLHSYKIEIRPPKNSADPGPDEIHCRSLPSPLPGQNHTVIHRFVFRVKPSDILNYRISVTSQKRVQSDAYAPRLPLEVHVD